MPVYEYKCRVCDEYFEVEQSFTDDTLTSIEGCAVDESGVHQVKKMFTAPAISFKGDGFYRNDARTSTDSTSRSSGDGSSGSSASSDGDGGSSGVKDSGSSEDSSSNGSGDSSSGATKATKTPSAAASSD